MLLYMHLITLFRIMNPHIKEANIFYVYDTINACERDAINGISESRNLTTVRVSLTRFKAHAHRRRRVCAAQIATRPVCVEQYIITGSKPERCVS